jgi:lipopolysaccharide biosynthesis glycosyltransferase
MKIKDIKKNLVYCSVFHQESYLKLLKLLIKSIKLFGDLNDTMDILVITNKSFKNSVQKILDNNQINGSIFCLPLNTLFEAGYSRLYIFDYPEIKKYKKVLYIDTDILVTTGTLLFNNCEEIKMLFFKVFNHIKKHIKEEKPIPWCLEQPFVVFHAITENLYNSRELIGKVVSWPTEYNDEIIAHFPGFPGNYEFKIDGIENYFNYMLQLKSK